MVCITEMACMRPVASYHCICIQIECFATVLLNFAHCCFGESQTHQSISARWWWQNGVIRAADSCHQCWSRRAGHADNCQGARLPVIATPGQQPWPPPPCHQGGLVLRLGALCPAVVAGAIFEEALASRLLSLPVIGEGEAKALSCSESKTWRGERLRLAGTPMASASDRLRPTACTRAIASRRDARMSDSSLSRTNSDPGPSGVALGTGSLAGSVALGIASTKVLGQSMGPAVGGGLDTVTVFRRVGSPFKSSCCIPADVSSTDMLVDIVRT